MYNPFQISGKMILGCNYWASHAGINMWKDWNLAVVEKDLQCLSSSGISILRIFPLWPDFQPITLLRGHAGLPTEYRIAEEPLADNEQGQAGVSVFAIEHFREFCDLAEKYNLKLVVALLTGWMSSRLFVPPALEGLNLITDPIAIQWECRFVKYFVSTFKKYSAICAWELGNECNCMASVPSSEAAWTWTSTIASVVKSIDSSRPFLSGMHSLTTEGTWTIMDQAELTDVLTTHPYPLFTPYCDLDPLNTIRPCLHAVSESLMYRGIGQKPCFAEELGTLGPSISSEEITADYIRTVLFSLWAHDCRALLWWCAFDQDQLAYAPYDWVSIERELGLFRSNRSPKPVIEEFKKFSLFLNNFSFDSLPERIVDAVCILTEGQDAWGAAYGSFILAKQAGIDIEFQYSHQRISDAKLYFLPSISGASSISRHRMNELLEKVREGSVLYISSGGASLSSFQELTGLKILSREKMTKPDYITFTNEISDIDLELFSPYRSNIEATTANVIAVNQEGMPAFSSNTCGKGKVFFLNYPVETYLVNKPGIFYGEQAMNFWEIYHQLKNSVATSKVVTSESPVIGITEHIINDNKRIIIAVNYQPVQSQSNLHLRDDWQLGECLYGDPSSVLVSIGKLLISISKNDAFVFTIEKCHE